MNTEPPTFDRLIELASRHEADPGPRPGFDTRLRATLAGLRRSRDDAAGLFAAWLWRAGWGLTPVAGVLAAALVVLDGFALPDGAGSVLAHLSTWLPNP